MKLKSNNMTLYVMLGVFFMFCELASSATVSVIINNDEVGDQEFPKDISVEITIDTSTTRHLHLSLVRQLNSIPVYTVDSDSHNWKITQQTLDDKEIGGVYQDAKHEAVVQLVKQADADGQGHVTFRIKRGEYLYNGTKYSIQPTVRSKRETPLDLNQSETTYEIKQLTDTSNTGNIGYIQSDFETKDSEPFGKNNFPKVASKLQKRYAFDTYHIDIAAFVDYTCYKYFLEEALNNTNLALLKIREYYAFIFAEVDLIYQNLMSNDFQLRINLAKLVILKNSKTIPMAYSKEYKNVLHGSQVLSNFRSFLRNNSGLTCDHATLFVRSYIADDNDTQFLVATGFNGKLCDSYGLSSSLVKDTQSYQVTQYVASTIGYSLSANIDGDDNNCSSQDNYLMGTTGENITESTKLNAWKFSNCTRKYFEDFIKALKKTTYGFVCLLSTLPAFEELPDISQRLLGQEVIPDEQCRLRSLNFNFHHETFNGTFADICTELLCVNSQNKSQHFVSPALSGTSCDCGKVCRQGQCVKEPLFNSIDCSVKDFWANCTLSLCTNNIFSRACQYTCANYIMYSSMTTTPKTTTTTATTTTGCKNGDKDRLECSSLTSCKGPETNCCETCRVNYAEPLSSNGMFLFYMAACTIVFLITK